MAFAYEGEAMDNGTLMVQGVASDPNKDKQAETPEMEVAKGSDRYSKHGGGPYLRRVR